MFLSTIINRRNCMVRKKKNHRCSQNFWIWGFQPYICTMCTARLPIWAYFGQKVLWLLCFSVSVSVFVSVFDIAPHPWIVKDICLCSTLKTLKWKVDSVSEWVTISPIESFIINFDWMILCKCSLIRLLKAFQLFLQAALPKTNNKPISISVCSLLQKLISRGNVRKLGT